MKIDYQALIDQVAEIARSAGQAIMEVYSSDDFDVTDKADDSPLTKADTAAHEVIVSALSTIKPRFPVLSEEDSRELERSDIDTLWLVDPLDGTKEFINRNGEFTVNIALIHQGAPILGVVYAPALDTLYTGSLETGASKTANGETTPIEARFEGSPPALVVSRSHRDTHVEKLLEKIGDYEVVSMGSSLKLCLIAEGAAMLYPRLAPTMEWDTAAADAVVRAAGGKVLRTDGSPLVYNKEDLHNPYFIAQTSGAIDWRSFDIF